MRAAACSRALRCLRSSRAKAPRSTFCDSSRAATRFTSTRSNCFVYLSTAASPRLRTSSQIFLTRSSTSLSNVVSNAISSPSCLSKPGRADESLLSTIGRRLGEGVEERLDCVPLELERRLVDDQARADGPDLLD